MTDQVLKPLCSGILLLFYISCAAVPVSLKRGDTIALWSFDDLSPLSISRYDLGDLLSAQVLRTIKRRADLKIVERDKLSEILDELGMGSTGLVDESTRLRLGRIAGARFMIFGGYQTIAETMRIDLRLVEVETGKVWNAIQNTTSSEDLPRVLQSAAEAAEKLIEPYPVR